MTAARQNAVKPPVAGPDNHFGNSTTAKAGDMSKPPLLGGKQEMNSDALPAAVAAQKRRTLSPYLLHKLNARHVVKAKRLPESITSSMAIPQKPADFVVAPTLTDPREIARKQTADNIKLFMSKGWTSYYSHNNEVLLYRAPDEGGTDTRKMVNTAWFVGDSSIVLFANALNCPDKSIDTFAYMELDGKTLKTTTSGVRDSAEKGTQLKDIQEASDLALHGKVCGN